MLSSNRQMGASPSVNGRTRVLGVVGYPIEHTFSPGMHNAAIAALGLSFIYIPLSVAPDSLETAVRSIVSLGIVGINVTIPHKQRIISMLDDVSPEATAIGAVNTVHNENGRLVGYNTDGSGFMRPLSARGIDLKDCSVVVLGAGGAARSVIFRLAREGARVHIVNRTISKAEDLCCSVRELYPSCKISITGWNKFAALEAVIAGADVLVNTTSVGMSPHNLEMPAIPPGALHSGLLVYDLIYNPKETRLLQAARTCGADTLNGLEMLVGQGAESFRIWTGIQPPEEIMMQSVLSQLSGDGME